MTASRAVSRALSRRFAQRSAFGTAWRCASTMSTSRSLISAAMLSSWLLIHFLDQAVMLRIFLLQRGELCLALRLLPPGQFLKLLFEPRALQHLLDFIVQCRRLL